MPPAGRTDGRADLDLRAISIEMGLVDDATGSVYLEMGSATRLLCSVRGPHAVSSGGAFSDTHGVLECELKFAPWHTENQSHQPPSSSSNVMNQTERQWAQQVKDALEPAVLLERYPKAAISINIVILQSSGAELAAAVTAVSIALLDAGIELRDLVTACSVVSFEGVEGQRRVLVDPTDEELSSLSDCGRAVSKVSIAAMSSLQEMTFLASYGRFADIELLSAMTKAALAGCGVIRTEIATKLRKQKE